jgi:DNA modification methylase
VRLILGDCLEKMRELDDNSVDSIVTDPPYGISFMSKGWDKGVPSVEIWKECLRVLKPGGHLLSFAGTRTQHRMATNIEDAGFEIRDMIAWVYGSGFPKSMNIGKAIDKLEGNERIEVGVSTQGSGASRIKLSNHEKGDTGIGYMDGSGKTFEVTKGNSQYEGWGTALKPALEPITVARKPIEEKTIAKNVLKYGTGGINIDGCRVPVDKNVDDMLRETSRGKRKSETWEKGSGFKNENNSLTGVRKEGRFPANLIHDGSEEVTSLFPDSKSTGGSGEKSKGGLGKQIYGKYALEEHGANSGGLGDSGSASRFFYCAKASKKDRNEGCDNLEEKQYSHDGRSKPIENAFQRNNSVASNNHPTVKPTELMQYLVRLVTPKNGIVLDPFMGSGSTGKACMLEGFDFIGIELDEEYIKIAEKRIAYAEKESRKYFNWDI